MLKLCHDVKVDTQLQHNLIWDHVRNMSNTMCVASGAGTAYPLGAPEFQWGYTVYILFI